METLKSKNVSLVLTLKVNESNRKNISRQPGAFFSAGIKSVTMDDIAKHLAVSKKTIYQFFADKNELVIALVTKRR
jgi:AcrR family transcriptional regulator